MMNKSYKELSKLPTFEERYEYLKLGGTVGRSTFGFERYLNQNFYRSTEWRKFRNGILVRDNCLDLGIEGMEIVGRVIVHHINPITMDDITSGADCLLDPNNVICTSHITSEAIHYGDASLLPKPIIARSKGDTDLWPSRRKAF